MNQSEYGSMRDRSAFQYLRETTPGGRMAPSDTRVLADQANITELFPDVYLLHCCDSAFAVDPANGAQQDFVIGRWNIPYDVSLISIRYEFSLPSVAGCSNGYLRVGQNLSNQAQTTHITNNFDVFWSEISGSLETKVRIYDPLMPYLRRIVRSTDILAGLQVFSVVGQAAYTIEYMVQMRVLKLGAMVASGR